MTNAVTFLKFFAGLAHVKTYIIRVRVNRLFNRIDMRIARYYECRNAMKANRVYDRIQVRFDKNRLHMLYAAAEIYKCTKLLETVYAK